MELEIDVVHSWLNQFEGSFLTMRTLPKVERLLSASGGAPKGEILPLLQDVKKMAYEIDKRDKLEAAELRVKAALVAFRYNEIQLATELLEAAVNGFGYQNKQHCYGFCQWLLGIVYWHLPGRAYAAVQSLQRSLDVIRDLAYSHQVSNPSWYLDRYVQMLRVFRWSVDRGFYCPLPSTTPWPGEGASPSPKESTKARPALRPGQITGLNPRLEIHEQIPPGGFAMAPADEITEVSFGQILIHGKPYYIADLQGNEQLNLAHRGGLKVVKVQDARLELSGIVEGDYVIIQPQNTASNNDLVAVDMWDVKEQKTLTTILKYVEDGDQVIFRPESTRKIYRTHRFPRDLAGFEILGLVIAVLKPEAPSGFENIFLEPGLSVLRVEVARTPYLVSLDKSGYFIRLSALLNILFTQLQLLDNSPPTFAIYEKELCAALGIEPPFLGVSDQIQGRYTEIYAFNAGFLNDFGQQPLKMETLHIDKSAVLYLAGNRKILVRMKSILDLTRKKNEKAHRMRTLKREWHQNSDAAIKKQLGTWLQILHHEIQSLIRERLAQKTFVEIRGLPLPDSDKSRLQRRMLALIEQIDSFGARVEIQHS